MKFFRFLPACALSCLLVACGGESEPAAPVEISTVKPPTPAPTVAQAQSLIVGQMINQAAQAQAKGLDGGRLTVNDAWTYDGYSTLTTIENPPFPVRFVAVDVTVEGQNANFDYDDIEIVDGADLTSFGSDPHVTFLDRDGKVLPLTARPPAPPSPVRALLIYGFPEDSKTFTLYYWGRKLVEAREIAKSGWALPYPKTRP